MSQVFSGNPEPRLTEKALINGVAVEAVPSCLAVLEPLGLASPSHASSGCICRH